ncbi:MAG: hypothetical protein COA96_05020 [SAR86 cluster bacterium]|uniref:Flagellar motor switch protein FliM n=1 Tax=SAR86 cluster bacterium TaxID=2030880 RepID=A0A2A5B5B0_9GAMM|nr:MAG: hypothetical protein COA96_05020 [SAR86 cluster bacterium]
MSELLSQNEIDALVTSADPNEPGARIVTFDDYELYDLASGMHRVKGWSHDVKIVDERFQTNLSIKLLGLLHKSVEVKRKEILISKYATYAKSLSAPTSINVFSLSGMMGYSAIVLNPSLVHALVNAFFGGGSRQTQIEARDFTHTEQRVIKLILKTIIETMKDSWKELSELKFTAIETEVNPENLSAYSDTDVLMIRSFSLEFSGGGGEIHLVIPGTTVDSIFRNRKSKALNSQMSSKEIMKLRAMSYEADVTAELTGANLTIGEIFRLAEGDIISVDSPEKIDVKVNGVVKYKAMMGEIGGKVCLKVIS